MYLPTDRPPSRRRPVVRGLGQSPSSFSALAQAIQQQEGYYPGSLSYRNNNPGNLIPAGQPGCSPGAGGFCSFPSYAAGFQALENQVALDASRGLTISQFTAKYAPASGGNDPVSYADFLAAQLGLNPGDALSAAASAPSLPGVGPSVNDFLASITSQGDSAVTDSSGSVDPSWIYWGLAAVGGLALVELA